MKITTISLITITMCALTGCFDEQEFNFPSEFSYVAFQSSEISILEGDVPQLEINIVYAGPELSSALVVPVSIATPGGIQAVDGVDYTIDGGISDVSIPAGQAQTTINVNILDNDEAIGPRELVLAVGSVSGIQVGKLGSDEGTEVKVIINEDDLFVFGYTGFEEPAAGDVNNYPSQDGVEQVNVPGENSVDHVSTGGEMGFNTSYVPGQEGGADSGLLFGVTKFTADVDWEYDVGAFTDGLQAYSTSDADGLMEIVFDELEIPGSTSLLVLDMQVHFIAASWEDDDEFDFFWRTEDGDELILSLRANADGDMTDSPDGSGNVIIDQWTQFVVEVDNIKNGSLVIQVGTDSGSEISFFDSIYIRGI